MEALKASGLLKLFSSRWYQRQTNKTILERLVFKHIRFLT